MIKNLFKKIKNSLAKYVYTNRLFIIYLLLALCGSIILRNVTIKGLFSIKPLITDLGLILIIGSFCYLIKPKNQFKYLFTIIIIFTIMEIVNSVYYTFYASFGSLSELSTLSQVKTVTGAVFSELRLVDFIYILEPFLFYYFHKNLKKTNYYYYVKNIEKKYKAFLITLAVGSIFLTYSMSTATSTDYSRLKKQWNKSYIVERFGIIMYQLNDVFLTIEPHINSLFGYSDAYTLFTNYYNSEDYSNYRTKNKYTGILKGYNVIYVHLESIQDFLMNLSFNGVDVTPNLNRLAKEGMFFNNFYSPVSTGTSSDAEYMSLTGLLPSSSGTVFVTYANNTFNSLPNDLKEKGYYTFSMHGNYASMWNRKKVHPAIGYDNMIFRESFNFTEDDVIGLGINDKIFFKQAVEKLEEIESLNSKYFGTLITLTNHSPFTSNENFNIDLKDYYEDGENSTCYLCERTIGKYIASSHYADEALGEFLELIKKSNKFNNTIFVFYGDHDAKLSYSEMNYFYNYDYLTGELKEENDPTYKKYDIYDYSLDKKTPLIIWTKNKKLAKKFTGTINYPMAMYDVAPTMYNMLNIKNDYVLGHDIFSIKNNNIVIYPNGNYLTKKVYYNNSTGEYKPLNEEVLTNDYITENATKAEKTLEVANAIINYDLFNPKKKDE